MPLRPMQNPGFYTKSRARCAEWIEDLAAQARGEVGVDTLVAGLVPHAGWAYSGAVAARVFRALRDRSQPETIILFGTVHYPGVERPTVYPEGAWETPLGAVEVDAELAAQLSSELGPELAEGVQAHEREHSLEVQMPFLRALFPDVRVVPIAMPPVPQAARLGAAIARATAAGETIAVGSTDLTHYGERFFLTPAGVGEEGHAWMRRNDARMLDLLTSMGAEEALEEAAREHNACGPGAIAATIAFAGERGAKRGWLLEYTTSHDAQPDPGPFEMGVGYAGVVY